MRCDCSRSPWMAAASRPYFFMDLATVSTSTLRLQKMIAFLQFSPSPSIRSRRSLRFSVPSRSLREPLNMTTDWVMFSDVVAWRATSMRAGFERNVFVMRSISGAMVAEKKSVWRVNGVRLKMRSISGIKPMSSMRSASSTTMICTPVSKSLPRSKWSSRRPGVAMRTSAPRLITASCSLKLTPPMSRALLSFTYLA